MEGILELPTRAGAFTVRPYRPGDEKAILDGWHRAFGKEMEEAVWRWKYPGNPLGVRVVVCLSEDGEVAVHFAGIPYRCRLGEETFQAVHSVDCYSRPDYRKVLVGRSGLFVQTAKAFFDTFTFEPGDDDPGDMEERAAFLYGFPGERHFRLGEKLLAYTRFSRDKVFFALPAESVISSKGLGRKPLLGGLEELELPESPGDISADASPRVEQFLEKADVLWTSSTDGPGAFSVVRDGSYLRWRFLSCPSRRYALYGFYTFPGNRLRGWLAGVFEGDDFKVLDFFFPGGAEAVVVAARALARLAAGLKDRVRALHVWASGNHPLTEGLFRAGFQPSPEPLGFVPCYCRSRLPAEVMNRFVWTMADGDLY